MLIICIDEAEIVGLVIKEPSFVLLPFVKALPPFQLTLKKLCSGNAVILRIPLPGPQHVAVPLGFGRNLFDQRDWV